MTRNLQILGTSARRVRRTVLASLGMTLLLGACGLKGPLYMPAPASTATPPNTLPSASQGAQPVPAPATSNTPAR